MHCASRAYDVVHCLTLLHSTCYSIIIYKLIELFEVPHVSVVLRVVQGLHSQLKQPTWMMLLSIGSFDLTYVDTIYGASVFDYIIIVQLNECAIICKLSFHVYSSNDNFGQ